MNAKIIQLNDELKTYQANGLDAKKKLIALNNEISSKSESYKSQQRKYEAMKLELEQREKQKKELETEISQYSKMDMKALNSNSYNAMIDKYLDELNIKKQLMQLLNEENKRIDQKFTVESKSLENNQDFNIPPEQEVYVKAMLEVITIKYIKRTVDDKKNHDEGNIQKLTSLVSYRINKDTTFDSLKEVACSFWKTPMEENDLTDENGAQLPESAKVQEYFKAHSQDIHTLLLYIKPREITKALTPGMVEVITSKDQQATGKIKNTNFQRVKKVEINGYEEFFAEFPGMKDYIDEDKLKQKENKILNGSSKKRIIDNNHFCLAFWLFIILLINVITLMLQRNNTRQHYILASLNTMLRIEDSYNHIDDSYQDIGTISDFNQFLTNSIQNALFYTDSDQDAPTFLVQNTYLSPLRIRQVRTKTREDCVMITRSASDIQCYYVEYNQDTKFTEDLSVGSTDDWVKYKTKEQNNIDSKIHGYSSDYDGSGYVYDFPNPTTYSEANTIFTELKTDNAFDSQTRAVFINANLYNQGMDQLLEIELGVEFTTAGLIRPLEKRVNFYKINRYDDKHYTMGIDVFKILVVIMLLIFSIYMTSTNENGSKAFNWRYFTTFPAVLNLILIILMLISVHNNFKLKNYGTTIQSLLSQSSFFDAKKYVDAYNNNFVVDSLIVFVIAVRLVQFLRLVSDFELGLNTISKAGVVLFRYFLTLIPILVSFGIIGMILWGSASSNFETYGKALISIIALGIGHFDEKIILNADTNLTAAFLTIYFFFFLFFLVTFFASVIIDTYRIVAMEAGAQTPSKDKMGLFQWMFGWLPISLWKKCISFIKNKSWKKSPQK